MLLMQGNMGNIDRTWPYILEFLFQFEEAILDFLLNVLWQLLLGADQIWVFGVRHSLLNQARLRSVEFVYRFVC